MTIVKLNSGMYQAITDDMTTVVGYIVRLRGRWYVGRASVPQSSYPSFATLRDAKRFAQLRHRIATLLAAYDAGLARRRDRLRAMYADAERRGDYSDADEYAADVGEQGLELIDEFVDALRAVIA